MPYETVSDLCYLIIISGGRILLFQFSLQEYSKKWDNKMLYYSWSVICIVLLICSFVSGFRAFTVRSKARTCQYFPLHINRALDMNTDAPVTPTSKLASQMLLGTESGNKYYPMGTTYCQCSLCKTAYLVDVEILGSKGLKLMCNVCKKDWFQTSERLLTTDDMHFLMPMPAIKVDEVKKILAEKNIPKYPRVDKIGIFVGNLPYKYTEEDITNLFAEYGLTDITLVRDAEQQSKGFAFIEVMAF